MTKIFPITKQLIFLSLLLILSGCKVTWSKSEVGVETMQGTSATTAVSFAPEMDLQNVKVRASRDIKHLINLEPLNFDLVKEATEVSIGIIASIPLDTPPGTYKGFVVVTSNGLPLPQKLKVNIEVKALVGFSVSGAAPLAPSADRIIEDQESGGFVVKDELLVVFEETASVSNIAQAMGSLGGIVTSRITSSSTYVVVFPEVESQIEILNLISLVRQVDIVKVVAQSSLSEERSIKCDPDETITIPTEGLWDCWSEENAAGNNQDIEVLRFPSAWNTTTGNTDKRVIIGVVDTGFDFNHEDLIKNTEYGLSVSEVFFPFGKAHGTAVAGIIAAEANNDGVTGAIWDAEVLLYPACVKIPLPFFDCKLMYDAAVMERMQAAIGKGARIINFSGGRDYEDADKLNDARANWSETLVDRNPNVLFVFSAGQGSTPKNDEISVPSSLATKKNVVAVTNMIRANRINGTTSTFGLNGEAYFGDNLVAAPGGGFPVATPGSTYGVLDEGDAPSTGTSFSAPFVTGLAGLLLSIDKDLTAEDLKTAIMDGAKNGGALVDSTAGDIYAINAMESVKLIVDAEEPPDSEVLFVDEFNRTDSIEVGNGWSNSPDNLGNNLQIVSNQLSIRYSGTPAGSKGIFRPSPGPLPLTLSATFFEGSGFGGLLRRYVGALGIQSSGDTNSGYRVVFVRSDSNANNSQVQLFDGPLLVDSVLLSNQFGQNIITSVTFQDDGSVEGTVTTNGLSEQFSFAAYASQSAGNNLLVTLQDPDGRATSPTSMRLDKFSVSDPALENDLQVSFFDDYESYALGTFPEEGGWILPSGLAGAGRSVQVVSNDQSQSGMASLRLESVLGLGSEARRAFEATERFASVKASVFPARDDARSGRVEISQNGQGAAVLFFPDGLIATDGRVGNPDFPFTSIGTYVANEWTEVLIILDTLTDTFDVFINGTEGGSDLPTIPTLRASEPRENFVSVYSDNNLLGGGGSGDGGSVVYIDDVEIRESGTQPEE